MIQTFDLGYETIFFVYNSFFTEDIISRTTWAIKFLAITLFVLSVGTNMLSRIGRKFGVGQDGIDFPFDANKLITSLIYVLVIASYDKLLGFLDGILLPLDSLFNEYSPTGFNYGENETDDTHDSVNWYSALKNFAEACLSILNGFGDDIILGLTYALAKVVDSAIYIVFLIERFFFLGLLKILGPFAILFSIHKATGEMFYKWLRLYAAIYLLIFPFFLIIGFTNEFYELLDEKLESIPVLTFMFSKSMKTIALFIMIWVKLRLFKKSYELVYKVVS